MKNIYLHNRNERFRLKNENNITLLSIILSKILVKKKKRKKKRHVKILIKVVFQPKEKHDTYQREKEIEILNHYFNHYKNQYEIYLSCDLWI